MTLPSALRALAFSLALSVGCAPKKAPPPPAPAFSAAAWVAHAVGPPLSYTEHTVEGPTLDPTLASSEPITETCTLETPTAGTADPLVAPHERRVCARTGPAGVERLSVFAAHDIGDLYLGSHLPGSPLPAAAPRVHVPARFDLGDSWSARHTLARGSELRRCDVSATPWCPEGAAVRCTTFGVHRVTWVRNHWCPGRGHVGHEAMAAKVGRPTLWSWSTDATRGGAPLPSLPLAERPFPDAAHLRAVARALSPERIAELSPDDALVSD